jgi:hypothetical protein
MMGYLLLMEQSEIVAKSTHPDILLYNGANIVIHIFTIYVHRNQSMENIVAQCCKAYVCYLEYIEQLDKANLGNNLYISDISIFVYKQTLGELEPSNSDITNHFHKPVLDLLPLLWNALLSWNNAFSIGARIAICDIYLHKYLILFSGMIGGAEPFIEGIGIIQCALHMDEHVYFAFLNEYYKSIAKYKRVGNFPNKNSIRENVWAFSMQSHTREIPTIENISNILKKLVG